MAKELKALNSINSVWELTKRNMLLFLKNKTTVFFSLLAPLLILVIYTLFVGDMQLETVRGMMPEGLELDDAAIKSVVNAWMVSGVIGIACLTVALNSMLTMVSDKETKAANDFTASPVRPVNLLLSYFLAAVILTFTICLLVLVVVLIFLAAAAGITLSFIDILELVGILLLSCLSAVIVMMCIMSLFKTNASSAAFTGVFSALIGFLTGAYFPLSFLPAGIRDVSCLIPATHSIGLFRKVLLQKALQKLPEGVPPDFVQQLKETYLFGPKVFGAELSGTHMYIFLAASVVLFFFVYLAMDRIRARLKK